MQRVFKFLLYLYPANYRRVFGKEILAVLEQSMEDRKGLSAGFFLTESFGMIGGAAREWAATFAGKRPQPANLTSGYDGLPEEVRSAQIRVDDAVKCMTQAISAHQFLKAREYSQQELQERADLRRLQRKYGLGEAPSEV